MSDIRQVGESPFDSFKIIQRLLIISGFYEIQTKNKYVYVSHFMFRIFGLIVIILYVISHFAYVFTIQNDIKALTHGLAVAIPQFNLFIKFSVMLFKTKRIRNIHQLIQDPIFFANNVKDAERIQKNNEDMKKLTKFAIISTFGCGSLWLSSFIFQRIEDPEHAHVPSSMPFETVSTKGYALSVLFETGPTLWVSFGHFGADCVIAIYYSQAKTQLIILKHNLEQVFANDGGKDDSIMSEVDDNASAGRFQYKDEADSNVRRNFIYYVERYNKIVWYTNEVSGVFDASMSLQFFSTSSSVCLVIYNMSMLTVASVDFFYMCFLLVLLQTQAFFYCYCGHLVENESLTINTSMYFSDWLSVSPRFRREILIAMTRWSRPLTPTVSNIIPVTLITFVAIVKLAYRLYTVMKTTQL